MAINYALMGRKAEKDMTGDSQTFKVGHTLGMLVAIERSYPLEMGSVTVDTYNGQNSVINQAFKRSVVTYDQDLCRESEEYRALLSFVPPESCPIAEFVSGLTGDDKKGAHTSTVTLWVFVELAWRATAKAPWAPTYTKPKWMTAKLGKKASPHLQHEINRVLSESTAQELQRIFSREICQLLIFDRKGDKLDTSYAGSLATGQDPTLGDLANFTVSEEIRGDIEEATVPGGPCDLLSVVAKIFSPDADEIADKLGASASRPKQPGMEE